MFFLLQILPGFKPLSVRCPKILFVVRPLFEPKTINYGTSCRWLGQLSDPRLPQWLFLRAPYSILVSSPENFPIFHSSSTKFCKRLSGSEYCVHVCFAISDLLDIFPFCCCDKVKYMMFSGENALFPDVANIALAKRPQQAHCRKFIFAYFPTFPGSASGTYHSDINVTLEQGRKGWCDTQNHSQESYITYMLNQPDNIVIIC